MQFARGIVTGWPSPASRLRDLRGSVSEASRARYGNAGRVNASRPYTHALRAVSLIAKMSRALTPSGVLLALVGGMERCASVWVFAFAAT
jgi:hypothetical protein